MIDSGDRRIVFATARDAERPVLGVATAAHAAAAAIRAGAPRVTIVLADGQRLSPAAADDLSRATAGRATIDDHCTGETPTFVPGEITARDLLRQTAKASDGFVSRWLNRPISRAISALLLRIPGVRPWHATALVAIVAATMLLSLLRGDAGGLIAGALLFHAASVLDGVDGEIARATYRSSAIGAKLDTAVDMATNIAFFFGVTVSLTALHGIAHAIAGGAAVACLAAGLMTMRLMAVRLGDPGNFNFLKNFYRTRYPSGIAAAITDVLVFTTSRDFFAFAVMVAVVIGWEEIVAFSLLGFATVWLVFILLAVRPILLARPDAAARAAVTIDDGVRPA